MSPPRCCIALHDPDSRILLTSRLLFKSASIFLFSLAAAAASSSSSPASPAGAMASCCNRSFVVWLHGVGSSGPDHEHIRGTFFSAPELRHTEWAFPTAATRSWFDIQLPIRAGSVQDESQVLKAVENVHAMIDMKVADGIPPENIFVCGFSQGGALALASVLLYPKTLGGGGVFSGWVPFGSSVVDRISAEARKTPILWSHGMADTIVLFEAGQAGLSFLQSLGVSCEFKAYPGLAHSIANEEYNSLEAWIKSRLN